MRLSPAHVEALKRLAAETVGPGARLRLDDDAHGGDVDLLRELAEPVAEPAMLAERLSARASRAMGGRKVDVLLGAPNLTRLPIHEVAEHGVLL